MDFYVCMSHIEYLLVCVHEPYSSLHLKVLRLIYEAVVTVPRIGRKQEGVSWLCFAKGHLCNHLQKLGS